MYSIIIPSKMGMPYLMFGVRSLLRQAFMNFELLVSVEETEVEAISFLAEIDDPRLFLVHPPVGLSMTEHWDWAQEKASGTWQMFLGQDDGVQADFFELLEELVGRASTEGLRLISSERAYIHWPGSTFDPDGKGIVSKVSREGQEIRNLSRDVLDALLGDKTYFELPQMYTTSVFHRSLIENARAAQGGKFLTCHPQDANLVAIGLAFEMQYLHSKRPFGWVGTSSRSAGAAISSVGKEDSMRTPEIRALAETYKASVHSSPLQYPAWAGDFNLAMTQIYLWQAIRKTSDMQKHQLVRKIESPRFIIQLIAKCWVDVAKSRRKFVRKGLGNLAVANDVKLSTGFFLEIARFKVRKTRARMVTLTRAIVRRLRRFLSLTSSEFRWVGPAGAPTDYPFVEGVVPFGVK